MSLWLTDMALIFFVYGAAFVAMGISVLRQPRPADCRLGSHIWLLGLFGLLHGANEWLDFLHVVHGTDPLLDSLRSLVLPISLLPLLEFGRRLMATRLDFAGTPWLTVGLAGLVLLTALLGDPDTSAFGARYILALPGGLLTGVGLWLYSRAEEGWLEVSGVRPVLKSTGLVFICYALLAGLVVPPQEFFPARWLNTETFQTWTGVPVQLFRALCALLAGLGIWRVLGAFEAEREYQLHQLAEEIRQRGGEQQLILEAAADGVLGLDADGLVTFSNPAAGAMLGHAPDWLVGRELHALTHVLADGRPCPTQQCEISKLLSTAGDQCSCEAFFRRADGHIFPVLLHAATLTGQSLTTTRAVLTFHDISERRAREQELEKRAHYDSLTGLANRVLLKLRLEQVLLQAKQHGTSVMLLVLDLDQFKLINSELGLGQGDRLLVEIARRLEQEAQESNTIARLDGDEFAIVLSSEPDTGDSVAQRLLMTLSAPLQLDMRTFYITASLGASLYPRDATDGETLLTNAATAMQHAKQAGRNRFQSYTREMHSRHAERLALLGDLKQAVEDNQLRLHYQPQIALPQGYIQGVEALVRWQHPEFGLLPPDRFIDLAEENGLIEPLGEWVLREGCQQAQQWNQAGYSGLRMAVNLSAYQLNNPQLTNLIRQVLQETGLPPAQLELELTESAVMADPEQSIRQIRAIRDLGVQLALDDFGIGYSSLGHLKRFSFDRLKIDRTFITDVVHNPEDAAIVRMIIAMARQLGIDTVAEGTETAETVAYLGRYGIQEIQGFFITPPLPARELEQHFLHRQQLQEVARLFYDRPHRTLLLLDDEINVLNALQRLLKPQGWQVLTATQPDEAFSLLARHAVQVVVSDQRMPEMSGIEFLSRIKDLHPHAMRIVLSGYTDLKTVTDAVNHGAIYKFLSKPWNEAQLINELEQAFLQAEQNNPQPDNIGISP